MTLEAVAVVALVVLIAVLVGAFLSVAVSGGDATVLGAAAATAAALLGGLFGLVYLRRRRGP